MRKSKLLILIVLSLLVSGCEVKYNIKISGTKISEEIIIPNTNNYTEETFIDEFYYDVGNNKKYEVTINDEEIILTNKKTKLKTLSTNDLYNFCFSKIDSYEEDGYYVFRTSSDFDCMTYEYLPVDKITIVLNTFNKVQKHNADKTKIGQYIWYIDRDNYSDKQIYFSVKKNEYLWYYKLRGLIFGLLAVLMLVIIYYLVVRIFKRKSEKENRI